jgi:hypothetical protein
MSVSCVRANDAKAHTCSTVAIGVRQSFSACYCSASASASNCRRLNALATTIPFPSGEVEPGCVKYCSQQQPELQPLDRLGLVHEWRVHPNRTGNSMLIDWLFVIFPFSSSLLPRVHYTVLCCKAAGHKWLRRRGWRILSDRIGKAGLRPCGKYAITVKRVPSLATI